MSGPQNNGYSDEGTIREILKVINQFENLQPNTENKKPWVSKRLCPN